MARLTGVKLASLLRLEQQAQPSTPLNFDGVVHASPMVRTMQTAAALVPALQSVGSDGSLLAEAAGVRRVFGLGECTFACRKKLGGLGQIEGGQRTSRLHQRGVHLKGRRHARREEMTQ